MAFEYTMIDRVAAWVRDAARLVVLTGAGFSAESGVPVFRGGDGLWRTHRPEDLATPEAFARQPDVVWDWYLWRRARIAAATPHAGHAVLTRLERARPGLVLLTQNVDGLHQRAGSRPPVELHGNLWRVRCAAGCGFETRDGETQTRTERRCACGAWLRPAVTWYGEPLDLVALDGAIAAAAEADVLIVAGTSSVVYPVAALPHVAHRAGAKVVEVNVEETPLSGQADAVLRGRASDVLPALEAGW